MTLKEQQALSLIHRLCAIEGLSLENARQVSRCIRQCFYRGSVKKEDFRILVERVPQLTAYIDSYTELSRRDMIFFVSNFGFYAHVLSESVLSKSDEINQQYESLHSVKINRCFYVFSRLVRADIGWIINMSRKAKSNFTYTYQRYGTEYTVGGHALAGLMNRATSDIEENTASPVSIKNNATGEVAGRERILDCWEERYT